MVNLARNEQYTALYPSTAHYSIGPFPARVIFRPSQGPFILGLISRIGLVTVRFWPVPFVSQFQPVVTFDPFVAR